MPTSGAPANILRRLDLGTVSLPETHPRASDGECPIFGFAIITADGVIVVDTGPRAGHPIIDELYAPKVTPLLVALGTARVDERDVIAIVNTHLHFDHCGQNDALPTTPVWVTKAEVTAAEAPGFTVPEWAEIDRPRRRLSSDGEPIAPGVTLIHTPGHSPGHQSVAVETHAGIEIIAGQACHHCDEFNAGELSASDMHDETWLDEGRRSLARLKSLGASRVHFSHDPRIATGAD